MTHRDDTPSNGDASTGKGERSSEADAPPVTEQREELAETVEALTRKLDVPSRVNAAAGERAQAAATAVRDNRQIVVGAAAGVLALVVLLIVRRRRREDDDR
ncbi:DUF3618 domain-containing protein [Rhodococcus rhodnii]|uniref:Deoxyuridine 5'-triphosphate nucleotidohydrolase n=2 Tax=Rhodococcus rhodnii TaxID=38312 RepID=R7WJY2_9NOCA|nr:DUF3618 domain-containing protein [Rhodococcus rhodnii]EOM75631.1 hypothetical protein Rrhod_3091 [Rhodococcus rhodnii LMG 5362]TXG91853.1 DUF3618 domain-containing protein [Rhodococcus rhodnii]